MASRPLSLPESRSASILLVDDDEPSLLIARRALEPLGQRLVFAVTGEEALEHVAREDFAVILLDLGLPGVGGLEVAELLLRQERTRHIPILFITGQAYTDALVARAYATGAVDLLFKPFNAEVIRTKVNVFVQLSLQRQRLTAQHEELLARTQALEHARQGQQAAEMTLRELQVDAMLEASERRRAEAERERLELVFSQAPVAIVILRGPRFVIELANPTMCRLWGRTREEVLGRPHFEVLPETADQGLEQVLEGVRTTGVPHVGREVPVRLSRREGGLEQAYFDSVYEPLRDRQGQIEGVIVVSTDVTGQVRARQRAEHVQAEMEAIFESMPDAAYVGDLTGIKRANRRALDMLGYASLKDLDVPVPQLAVRANLRWADSGEPVPVEQMGLARAIAGETRSGEYLLANATTGQDMVVRSASSPVWQQGRVIAAVVVHTDITEQRAAEDALRRSAEEFRTLAEFVPLALWTHAADGQLTYVNSVFTRYTGLGVEQLQGPDYQRMIHPDDVAGSLTHWQRSLGTGAPLELEERWRRHDGAYRWHLVRALPLRDAAGRVVRWLGTGTDVHDLRQYQQELQRRVDFEQQLIGIVSHDLRNPLSAILLGVTSLTRRQELDTPSRQAALRIRSSAERATRMIRDLLDFTQARLGGGIRIERGPADLHRVTQSVLEEIEATHSEREVELRCTGDGQGEWDADRVAQVVQNLVTNALKYSPPESRVLVETSAEEHHAVLRVHNQGTPLSPERRQHLFEPLSRAANEVDKASRSVGLGLYIVDQLVRAHGGQVEVDSSAERGTTFTVRLPRLPPEPTH